MTRESRLESSTWAVAVYRFAGAAPGPGERLAIPMVSIPLAQWFTERPVSRQPAGPAARCALTQAELSDGTGDFGSFFSGTERRAARPSSKMIRTARAIAVTRTLMPGSKEL